MSVLLTNHFSFLQAKLFKDSFADTSENKYVFLAKIDSYGGDDEISHFYPSPSLINNIDSFIW